MAELTRLGRYKLVRVLGRGAMGVVYEGLDPALNRRIAIKTILRNAAIDEETARGYSALFAREAQAAGRLSHANIVQVHDFAVEGDVAYLVMEYIQGRELRSYFEAREKFGLAEVVRIMGELLEALDFAHEAGVIHRDVKPANVMLDAQRRVKLADFGVARIQDSERSAAGTMVGTPAFMSPEQIQGGKIDRRTDIFSAGVVLYQLLTGEQPFAGAGAWTVAKKIMQDDPPAPSSITAGVSPVFDAIVNRALAKNPADRFAKAREFAAALRTAYEKARQPGAATRLRQQEAAIAEADPHATVPIPRPASSEQKKKILYPAVIGALVVIGGVAASLVLNRKPAEPPPPAAGPLQPAPPAADEEKIRREVEEKLRREFAEKSAAEQATAKAAAEKVIAEKVASEKALTVKATAEKVAQEKAIADKLQAEKLAAARSAGERAALEKAAAEKAAAEKAAAEKVAAEKLAADKLQAEKLAAAKVAGERAALEKTVAEKAEAAKAAAPPDMAASPLPTAGTTYRYRWTDRKFGKKQEFAARIDRIDAWRVSETILVGGAPIASGTMDAQGRNFSGRMLGDGKSLLEFAPYLIPSKKGETMVLGDNFNYPTGGLESWQYLARQTGPERVVVPAGSYEAMGIQISGSRRTNATHYMRADTAERFEFTAWYAQEVKRYVKLQHRTWNGFKNELSDELVELLQFSQK